MNPTCLALDFDHTLSYFEGNYDKMFDIFVRQGAPLQLVKESYEKSLRSASSLLNILKDETDIVFDVDKIYSEYNKWLEESLKLYPDAERFLKKQNLPVAIVTLGDAGYQEQKVQRLKIKYDDFETVTEIDGKPDKIEILLEKYGAPIIYVDDKNSELDRVRERFDESKVQTYLIDRKEGPYNSEKPKFKHKIIQSLNELPV